MLVDVVRHVKTCDPCQRMKNAQPFVTNRLVPHSGLLDVISIDFAGDPATMKVCNRFFLGLQNKLGFSKDDERIIKSVAIGGERAACDHSQAFKQDSKQLPMTTYEVENYVLVASLMPFQSMNGL